MNRVRSPVRWMTLSCVVWWSVSGAACNERPPFPPAPTREEADRFAAEMIASLASKDRQWIERHAEPRLVEDQGSVVSVQSLNAEARAAFIDIHGKVRPVIAAVRLK